VFHARRSLICSTPSLIAALLWPAALQAQADANCAALANAPPGLYVKTLASDKPVPVTGPLDYDINARFYFLPPDDARLVGENQEAVFHVRSQTVADSDLRADETLVFRERVRTSCRDGQFAQPFMGETFESFDRNSRYVSLNRYFDHHARNESDRRTDPGLRTYFHLEISDINNNCFRTDDSRRVGPLHDAYGFPDVTPAAVLVARYTQPVSSAVAAPAAQSRRYAGLSSELAYVRGPAPACFSFSAPRPTVSSLRGQILTWWRDDYAIAQARTWRPTRTELVIHRVPKGRSMKASIDWRN